jgi:hypothetical protein
MRSILRPFLVAAFAAVLSLATPLIAAAIPHAEAIVTDQTRDTLLPDGTLLRIALTSNVSSAHSKTGDAIAYKVVDDVKIGDRVAIPAGTGGTGKVLKAEPAHGGRVDGILRLQFDPIKLADGTMVDIDITEASLVADQNQHNGMATSVADVADVTVPGFFLIDFLRKGDDVTLGANSPFHVAVTMDAYLSPLPAAPAVPATSPAPASTP